MAVRVADTSNLGIVGAELWLAYDSSVLTSVSVDTTGGMVAGWAVAENVIAGAGGIDTLVFVAATAQDTLTGAGDLIYFDLVTSAVRQPDESTLTLTRAVFNEGAPGSSINNGSLRLVGTDGAVQSSSVVQADTGGVAGIPDTMRVEVSDVDLNVDPGQVDTVDVLVRNTASGELELTRKL